MTSNAPAELPTDTTDDEFAFMLRFQLQSARKNLAETTEATTGNTVAHMVQWNLASMVRAETQLAVLETADAGGTVDAQRRLLADELGRYLVNGTAHSEPFARALTEVQRDAATRLLGLFKAHVDLARVFRAA